MIGKQDGTREALARNLVREEASRMCVTFGDSRIEFPFHVESNLYKTRDKGD